MLLGILLFRGNKQPRLQVVVKLRESSVRLGGNKTEVFVREQPPADFCFGRLTFFPSFFPDNYRATSAAVVTRNVDWSSHNVPVV